MPFVEGPTLRDYLTQHSRLSVSEGLRLTVQIAGALDYAHRLGIVHLIGDTIDAVESAAFLSAQQRRDIF